jgi:ferredoxin
MVSGKRISAGKPSGSGLDPSLSAFLNNLRIDPSIHNDMLKALKSVFGNALSVQHLRSFGTEGLKELAESVNKEKQRSSFTRRKREARFVVPHHRTEFVLRWREGTSLLELAKSSKGELLAEYLEGTCGGHMSCCTCHVYLSRNVLEAMPPPTEAELDMLDLAYEPTDNSRLGCQVRLTDKLLDLSSEIVVTIPPGVNNVWT